MQYILKSTSLDSKLEIKCFPYDKVDVFVCSMLDLGIIISLGPSDFILIVVNQWGKVMILNSVTQIR